MRDEQRGVVRGIVGQVVLEDPCALDFVRGVGIRTGKMRCRGTLELNADLVEHFKQRIAERGMTVEEVVIVLVNVDDVHGGHIAEILMRGYDWQNIRDIGEIPFVRGLADREVIQGILEMLDQEAASKLRDMTEVAVVVVDHGVAEVFSV